MKNEEEILEESAAKFVTITGGINSNKVFREIVKASEKGDNYHPKGIYPREEYEELSWTGIRNRVESAAKEEMKNQLKAPMKKSKLKP